MKDLLSLVLIAVYIGCIYRYTVIFLGKEPMLMRTLPEFSRIGILIFGGLLFVFQAFADAAFEGWLIVVLIVGGGIFFLL